MAVKTVEQKVKRQGFFKGVRSEFKKVVWPTKRELFYYTVAVIACSIIIAAFVWGIDQILKSILGLIIRH